MSGSVGAQRSYDHNYYMVLRAMHRYARPRTYLEIGIYRGDSLRLATPSTRVVGIDPEPHIEGRTPRRWSVYAETSDAFFERPDVASLTGTVDVAFIDGLHLCEQALRDFAHVEARMAANGVVVFHDCLPPDAASAGRAVTPGSWAGDVWKLIPILHEYRPDLDVVVAAAGPSGLGIVTGLDPSSQVLHDHYDEIIERYGDLEFTPWPEVRDGTWAALSGVFPEFRPVQLGDELRRKARTARQLISQRVGRRPSRPG